MSQVAIGGFRAEKFFRECPIIHSKVSKFFKGVTTVIKKSPHGLKHDNIVHIGDVQFPVQNKKFKNFGGRGDSFDRRPIASAFTQPDIQFQLDKLCNKRSMNKEQKAGFEELLKANTAEVKQYLSSCIGDSLYWVFMHTDDCSEVTLYIVETSRLKEWIYQNINIQVKRTCVHITPNIYVQRKGGGKTDPRPDDTQIKLKITPSLIEICTRLE
jgi:hypothetical protein